MVPNPTANGDDMLALSSTHQVTANKKKVKLPSRPVLPTPFLVLQEKGWSKMANSGASNAEYMASDDNRKDSPWRW